LIRPASIDGVSARGLQFSPPLYFKRAERGRWRAPREQSDLGSTLAYTAFVMNRYQTADLWDWADESDSQVRVRRPEPREQDPVFEVVQRKGPRAAPDVEDLEMERFFAEPSQRESFADLDDEDPRISLMWQARRPRRVAVKVLGLMGLAAAITAVVAIFQVGTARGEIADWATMGQVQEVGGARAIVKQPAAEHSSWVDARTWR